MKMWSMLMLVAMMLPLCTSCSKDGDDTPSMKFTKELITGNFGWVITSVQVTKGTPIHTPQVGDFIIFYADGSCLSSQSMETAYRITSGKIETYYAETLEPMYVYTLTATNGDELTVRRDGTLDDMSRCVIKLKKQAFVE